MTALKGLLEASVLLVIAAAAAAVAALTWITIGSGDFVGRFGVCLFLLGVLSCLGGNMMLSRKETHDFFAWLGQGPERGGPDDGGGRVLTGIGVFLFVALPLFIVGAALAT
jgi:hypothetical protein